MNANCQFNRYILIFLTAVIFIVSGETNDRATAQTGAVNTPRTLYVFGDSWAEDMTTSLNLLNPALTSRGFGSFVTVNARAVRGSTMAKWAADNPCGDCPGAFTELQQAIMNDPREAPIVFFTLGGNDITENFIQSGPNQAVFTTIAQDLRTILNALKAARSDVQIIIGGYDILNPNINTFLCVTALQTIFLTIS